MSTGTNEEYADLKGKTFQVFGDRIVVKKLSPPKTSSLELPKSLTDAADWKYARVLQVGPACYQGIVNPIDPDEFKGAPIPLKENDIVVIPDFAGSEMEVDGEAVMIIREDEVIGKFS